MIRSIPGRLLLAALLAAPLFAQGIVVDEVPQPTVPPQERVAFRQVYIKHHGIEAVVRQGVAETTIDQVFHNPNQQILEGTYIFPLPETAAIGRFTMFMNGKEIEGEILDADRARGIYESIVRSQRDPALLEYAGRKMIRARVFPIPADGDFRIKIKYAQELSTESGVTAYEYPLNSSKFSRQPLEQVTVSLDLESDIPLKSVYSPTHPVEVVREGDHKAKIYFEGQNVVPDSDFKLYYQISTKEFGLALLTHRKAGEDGYFLVMISPKEEYAADEIAPKDLTLVVDTSGSMLGSKMDQAKAALTYCVDNLNTQDRFRLIRFSTDVEAFGADFAQATEDNLRSARSWIGGIEARGGTNIMGALEEALEATTDPGRLHLIVFVTDGKPTIGERDAVKIIENVAGKNAAAVRLHVFGVGDNLNTHLLDKLAEGNRGTRSYVGEKDDLDARMAGFYEKVASPVLSDLELTLGSIRVRDLYPKKLPDLFKGTQLTLFGRYQGEGDDSLTLSGRIGAEGREFVYEGSFASALDENDFLPRLWAQRKVGFLLDQIRLHGESEELTAEIVRLGKKHGIVTPYTSFLVLEDGMRADDFDGGNRNGEGGPGDAEALRRLESRVRERTASTGRPAPPPGADADPADRPTGSSSGHGGVVPAESPESEPEPGKLGEYFDRMGGRGTREEQSGEKAVELSKSLRDMKEAQNLAEQSQRERDAGLDTLIRKIDDKTFYWRGESWVDSLFDAEAKPEIVEVTFMSEAYFALVKEHAKIGRYLSLGESVVVVIDGKVYRIAPEAAQDEDQEEGQPEQGREEGQEK